ncbi:MAG: hypothetical protein AAGN35_00730 [Bacteroidota bacterium]
MLDFSPDTEFHFAHLALRREANRIDDALDDALRQSLARFTEVFAHTPPYYVTGSRKIAGDCLAQSIWEYPLQTQDAEEATWIHLLENDLDPNDVHLLGRQLLRTGLLIWLGILKCSDHRERETGSWQYYKDFAPILPLRHRLSRAWNDKSLVMEEEQFQFLATSYWGQTLVLLHLYAMGLWGESIPESQQRHIQSRLASSPPTIDVLLISRIRGILAVDPRPADERNHRQSFSNLLSKSYLKDSTVRVLRVTEQIWQATPAAQMIVAFTEICVQYDLQWSEPGAGAHFRERRKEALRQIRRDYADLIAQARTFLAENPEQRPTLILAGIIGLLNGFAFRTDADELLLVELRQVRDKQLADLIHHNWVSSAEEIALLFALRGFAASEISISVNTWLPYIKKMHWGMDLITLHLVRSTVQHLSFSANDEMAALADLINNRLNDEYTEIEAAIRNAEPLLYH